MQQDWLHQSILCNPNGRRTILGFHGFGGSPFDYKPLCDRIIQQNFRVVLPKINDAHLAKVAEESISLDSWLQPYQSILEQELQRDPNLCLMGFSMGGAMSSIFAQKFPISKLILLAPYYGLPHFDTIATSMGNSLSAIIPRIPKFQSGRIQSREGRKKYQCPIYSVDVGAFVGLQSLAHQARIYVQKISSKKHILWCHGPDDPVASYQKAQSVMPAFAKHVLLPQTDHIVLYDNDAQLVIAQIENFL